MAHLGNYISLRDEFNRTQQKIKEQISETKKDEDEIARCQFNTLNKQKLEYAISCHKTEMEFQILFKKQQEKLDELQICYNDNILARDTQIDQLKLVIEMQNNKIGELHNDIKILKEINDKIEKIKSNSDKLDYLASNKIIRKIPPRISPRIPPRIPPRIQHS